MLNGCQCQDFIHNPIPSNNKIISATSVPPLKRRQKRPKMAAFASFIGQFSTTCSEIERTMWCDCHGTRVVAVCHIRHIWARNILFRMFRAQNQHGINGHEIQIILVFVPKNMRKAIQPMRQARDHGGIHPQKHEGILTFRPDALACEDSPPSTHSTGQSPQNSRRPQSRQKSPRQTESNCSTSGATRAGSSVRMPFSKLRLRSDFAPMPAPVRFALPK